MAIHVYTCTLKRMIVKIFQLFLVSKVDNKLDKSPEVILEGQVLHRERLLDSVDIFRFTSLRELTESVFKEAKKQSGRSYSLRRFASDLGYANASFLSDVLNRKRKPNPKLAESISNFLNLDQERRQHIPKLLFNDMAGVVAAPVVFDSISAKAIELEDFSPISEWYYIVILELVNLSTFREDSVWIARKLGLGIHPITVENAIGKLIRYRFLERNKAGRLVRTDEQLQIWPKKQEASVIRRFHKAMIDRALKAIDHQPVEMRHISSTTFAFNRKDYPHIEEIVKEFHGKLRALTSENDPDSVYTLAVQFFCQDGEHS
jgi:uncharacterized protein (TIGR02147 family)